MFVFSVLYSVNLASYYLFKKNVSISIEHCGVFFRTNLKLTLTWKWQLMSRHLRVRHAVVAFHVKIIHCPMSFFHLSWRLRVHELSWCMKACGQTRLWSSCRTRRHCFFSCSREQSQRISILWSVFPNWAGTLFSVTIVLSVLCLSVLRGLLPSCAYAVISIQDDFIPDTGVCGHLLFWTGIWAQDVAYYIHTHATRFLGSGSGQASSQTSGGDWKGTFPCQQHCRVNHLFLTLVYLGLFIPKVFGIHCNPAENLYWNHSVSNSTLDPKHCNASFT